MTFLNLNSNLEMMLGIIVLVGVVAGIYSLLDKHEKLKTLAGIVWIIGSIIILGLVISAFYWTIK